MNTRPQFDQEYISQEFEKIGSAIETEVTAYLVGGGAMSFRDLKDTTKDIDLVVTEDEKFERLLDTLGEVGYKEVTELGDEYDQLGARICVKNDDGCQIDLFNTQIADKLFFSEGMKKRSEDLRSNTYLSVKVASLEDIFLFKSVAERPADIDDMATLVRTELDFEAIEREIRTQVELIGGERFTTIISESLEKLDERHNIQTPLDETIEGHYGRYMQGLELRMALDEEKPKQIDKLAEELDLSEEEAETRIDYLERFGAAERSSGGVVDTGKHDRFKRSE